MGACRTRPYSQPARRRLKLPALSDNEIAIGPSVRAVKETEGGAASAFAKDHAWHGVVMHRLTGSR
jgi:hypothetical protein